MTLFKAAAPPADQGQNHQNDDRNHTADDEIVQFHTATPLLSPGHYVR